MWCIVLLLLSQCPQYGWDSDGDCISNNTEAANGWNSGLPYGVSSPVPLMGSQPCARTYEDWDGDCVPNTIDEMSSGSLVFADRVDPLRPVASVGVFGATRDDYDGDGFGNLVDKNPFVPGTAESTDPRNDYRTVVVMMLGLILACVLYLAVWPRARGYGY